MLGDNYKTPYLYPKNRKWLREFCAKQKTESAAQ